MTSFGTHQQTRGSIKDLAVAEDGRAAVAIAGGTGQPITVAMLGSDGVLDRSFSADGLLTPQLEPGRPFREGAVQLAFAGRSLIVAGTVRDPEGEGIEVRKYLPTGRLDRRFGSGGIITAPFKVAEAIFVADSGRIAVFGSGSRVPGGVFSGGGLVLLSSDGVPVRTTRLPPAGDIESVSLLAAGGFLVWADNGEEPFRSAILRLGPTGRILHRSEEVVEPRAFAYRVIGATDSGAALAINEGRLVRFRPDDRTPDPAFGSVPLHCPGDESEPASYEQGLRQPGGKILLVGFCGLARVEADGAPDPTFPERDLREGMDYSGFPLDLGPDGRIRYALWNESASAAEVVRLRPDGDPDPTFASGGRALVRLRAPVPATANDVIAAPGGRLIAAGAACGETCRGFALARYDRRGRLDRSFGRAGRVLYSAHRLGAARAVALTRSGEIIAGGATLKNRQGKERAFALLKLRPSGRPDRRFGRRGAAVHQLSPKAGQRSEITDLAVQPDGRIVAAGLSEGCGRSGNLCFTVARFLPRGALDRTFARGGVLRLRGLSGAANAIALARGGKIVASGGGYGHFVTVRLTRRGRLDRSFGHRGVVDRRQRIRFRGSDRDVVDLGIGAEAVAVGRHGDVTVAGGGHSGHSVVERYGPRGNRIPRFGHGGRVLFPRFGIRDLGVSRCGLLAAGTVHAGGRRQALGLIGIGRSGRKKSRPRPLFGPRRASHGAAVALASGRAVAAGMVVPFTGGRQFALAATPLRSLLPRC